MISKQAPPKYCMPRQNITLLHRLGKRPTLGITGVDTLKVSYKYQA